MSDAAALILAAGAGERLGAETPKAFLPVAGTTMLALSVRSAELSGAVRSLVIVVPGGWEARAASLVNCALLPTFVEGGPTRQASVRRGLAAVRAPTAVVACHDAARPFASPALFTRVIGALDNDDEADGIVPVVPIPDTVKRVRDGRVVETVPRESLALAQTPQAFRLEPLRRAHASALEESVEATDDAALIERYGHVVRTIPGEATNFKVTTAEDLARAEAILSGMGPVGAAQA